MNAEPHDDDVALPGDGAVRDAFAAYRAGASASFPPPPVDDLLMHGPAALRRRRLVSLAAVVGACTAVTAGGFAVAQTIGSTTEEPGHDPTTVIGSATGAPSDDTGLDDSTTPAPDDDSSDPDSSAAGDGDAEPTVVIGDWDGVCQGGEFAADADTWQLTGDGDWTVEQAVAADVTGDDAPETLLALSCGGRTAVAAFDPAGSGLEQFAWVWKPDESQELSEIADVAGGVITLQGLGDAAATWTARYEWDGSAFVEKDDESTTETTAPEDSGSPDPSETDTTQAAPTATESGA